jgi:hypothetical protein
MNDGKTLWPRFSPEINLGHLLQAVVFLVTVGGGAITSYLSLRSDIQQVRADLTVRVSEHEVRLGTMEHASEDQRKEVREFQGEMRSAISRVTEILNDVRIQLGRRLPPHG